MPPATEFVVTTDSNHDRPVYPNLAGELELTGLNQVWVADITYIRLELEFVYLAVVLDAYSRRVIGWAQEALVGG
jgi:putative transposase